MSYSNDWSNEWANHNQLIDLNERLKKLEAENAKLRECVEKVAYNYDRPTDMMNSARQVLKELRK